MPTTCQPRKLYSLDGTLYFCSRNLKIHSKMKKLLTILCAMLLTVSAQAKDKVLDRPAFRSSSNSLYPAKVELKKKETVVHFHIDCSHWREWSMDGARLECDGQTLAYQTGRIITHEGRRVLADDVFELGKTYGPNAQQDSLILTFAPLPKGTKAFDYIESGLEGGWHIRGIRLDGKQYGSIFPAYQPPVDDGQPLKPLIPTYGKATTTVTSHGGKGCSYFGPPACDPITGKYETETQYLDSVTVFCHPAYLPMRVVWIGPDIDASGYGGQFPLLHVPGETLTLDIDACACAERSLGCKANVGPHDYYRLGGTLADLNQVILENQVLAQVQSKEVPEYQDGETFGQWSERLWQRIDSIRQCMLQRPDYTRRQRDYAQLLADRAYLNIRQNYEPALRYKMWTLRLNADSAVSRLKTTYTLEDPHARDLHLFRDGTTYYATTNTGYLPYLRANGLDHGEVYDFLAAFDEAIALGQKMKKVEVQTDSAIARIHPYFQPVLRAFNDSTRMLVERLQREAKERMKPTPDVPADQLLQTIAAQYPGKAVFFDLWATWCGPCMKGIHAMEPMKEELKGKDVYFVYLTNESSPLNEWSEQVLRIPGQHYRIPNALWSKIPDVSSIPQYFLYDSEGRCSWQQTGFDDATIGTIFQEIEKVCK